MRTRSALAAAALVAAVLAGQTALTGAAEAASHAGSPGRTHPAAQVADRAKAATRTTAAIRDGYLVGKVTSGGKGVKGLKVRVQLKSGATWVIYSTLTTARGGRFSAPLTRNTTYRATTLATAKYKGSTSGPVRP